MVQYKAFLELFQKLQLQIYTSQFMTFLLNLESVERKRKNYKDLNNEMKQKTFFTVFERVSFGKKTKI